ncbi:hypothetical protein [Azorhizobium doebereinerae]|uniref:hypothetical protein n=1 Tax=Azorhizobium doebereinerae TaxID=281091 RepID=UPI000404AE14|nr:hypothetical protein [Azorhizobium doebereinerae]
METAGRGWELRIERRRVQRRGGRLRTVGLYQVFHAGVAQPGLAGMSAEPHGPGDNRVMGNGRRLEAGAYPLATQAGRDYVTFGHCAGEDPGRTPKPALAVDGTGNRTEILIHPGHGFLASTGCINLAAPLARGTRDIAFLDSRARVVAVIEDLRVFAGAGFPPENGRPIAGAWLVIAGEP